MTIKEKLLEEFGCAISAILGDVADEEFTEPNDLDLEDIMAIGRKVAFYLNK